MHREADMAKGKTRVKPKANAKLGLSLSEFTSEVADDLRALRSKPPEPGGPVIQFKECTLEASVEISVDAKGGVKFWIVEFGAGASRKANHKVTLKFDAVGTVVRFAGGRTPAGPSEDATT